MKRCVIAIDGPAGAGKSTIARLVAKRLGFLYIDTGAMYRALTFKALRDGIDFSDEEAVVRMAKGSDIKLVPTPGDAGQLSVVLDGRDVSREIRTQEIARHINDLSANKGVREILRDKQRAMGADAGIVMEGRDIGTAVFPDAEYKFYLDASVEERAGRRFRELQAKGDTPDLAEIRRSIQDRDFKDKNREVSPLRQAPDAIVVDSTSMTIEQVADTIARKINGN